MRWLQRASGRVLKVSRAFAAVMPDLRPLRFLIAERSLALRADALGLSIAGPAHQLDIADGTVLAQMTGDREIVDYAFGS